MKIAVLLSGGVDSAVSLTLLKNSGYDVTAFYLKIWLEDELAFLGQCPWEQDLRYARQVCQDLGVSLEIVSLQHDYWEKIVSYVIKQVRQGYTPNPDMLCNNIIKFGCFHDLVGYQFDYIASGHYAGIIHRPDVSFLVAAADSVKDQTYFLASLSPQQLKKCLFPLGAFTKNEVRSIARGCRLANAERKDSQGVCFLGKMRFSDFIGCHLGEKEGKMVDWDSGKVVGEHSGHWYFTIGQRRGIKLGNGPWYVVEKDSSANIVYVSRELLTKKVNEMRVLHCHWLYPRDVLQKLLRRDDDCGKNNDDQPKSKNSLQVKIRHGEKKITVFCGLDDEKKNLFADNPENLFADGLPSSLFCRLDSGDEGLASGQFAVFYSGSYCLGSGVIERIKHTTFVAQ